MKKSKLLFSSGGERHFRKYRLMPVKLMENCSFPAHITLLVTYLEAVAWLKHPWHDHRSAGISMTKGILLFAFHSHLLFNGMFLFAFPILPHQVSC